MLHKISKIDKIPTKFNDLALKILPVRITCIWHLSAAVKQPGMLGVGFELKAKS